MSYYVGIDLHSDNNYTGVIDKEDSRTEMPLYSGMKYTDDKWDSYWLAHMLRLGILPEGYIYPKEIRPVRDLLRKRTMLVRHRTAHILSLQNMMDRNTGRKLKVNDAKRLSEEKISS